MTTASQPHAMRMPCRNARHRRRHLNGNRIQSLLNDYSNNNNNSRGSESLISNANRNNVNESCNSSKYNNNNNNKGSV